ncbi:glycosyltransferase [Methanophagales archaeon]|nr:MAG: glycosyltransferase [Methanophagales archaeon]
MTKEALAFIKTLPNKKIRDKSLKEILSYENVSLWWFTEFFLFHRLKEALKNVKRKSKNFELFLSLFVKYYILAKALLRYFLGRLITLRYNTKKTENIPKIIAISYSMNWRNATMPGIKKQKEDIMLGNIINELIARNKEVIALDQDTSFFVDIKTLIEKAIYKKGLWKPVETYLTLAIIKKVLRTYREFREEVKKLKRDEDLQFLDPLKDDFLISFRYHIFYAMLYIELMKRVIEIEKPGLILITCEYCLLGRAAVVAGKLKGVPTLAVQHGNISPYHIGYYHPAEEISDEITPQYCPIPDKTAVYGEYTKKILTEVCNYPADNVVITGSPRYDILSRADEIYIREEFRKMLNLDSDKKIALITTENLPILEENTIFLRSVLRALKELPEVQAVIKPHPGEKSEWYKEIVEEEEVGAKILPKDSNTFEALYACDLLITCFSTVATEAMILNKPVITVNLTGAPDQMPYAESGAAIGVYKEEDIAPAIHDALYNEEVRGRLAINMKKFVYEHAYRQDGKATERVVELIHNMIKGI